MKGREIRDWRLEIDEISKSPISVPLHAQAHLQPPLENFRQNAREGVGLGADPIRRRRQATANLSGYAKTTIIATTPYGSTPLFQYGSATVYIKYRTGGSNIVKPLIVAEGLDDGIVLKPEQEAGSNNIEIFLRDVNNSASSLPFETNQYDIIYVDWNNGVDLDRKSVV